MNMHKGNAVRNLVGKRWITDNVNMLNARQHSDIFSCKPCGYLCATIKDKLQNAPKHTGKLFINVGCKKSTSYI